MRTTTQALHRLALVLALLMAVVSAISQPVAAQDTKDDRELCKDGGWQTLVRSEDRSPFANQGECVSYADAGGVPVPPAAISPVISVSSSAATTSAGTSGFTLSVSGEGFRPGQPLYIVASYSAGAAGVSAFADGNGNLQYAFAGVRDCTGSLGMRTTVTVEVFDYEGFVASPLLASATVPLPCSEPSGT